MIEKPSIIITSLGRTGTQFWGHFLGKIIPDITSLHEPDAFHFEPGYGLSDIQRQIREAGLTNFLIRKPLGKWMMIKISDERVKRKISGAEAKKKVLQQREAFVNKQTGSLYAETGSGYYGLLDVLPLVFKEHKVVFFIRNGQDWIRSWMNYGNMYGRSKLKQIITHSWPSGADFPEDSYYEQWHQLTAFEKLCWAWTNLNRYALETLPKNKNARLYLFEDIFKSPERYEKLQEMVAFLTEFSTQPPIEVKPMAGLLDKPMHQSNKDFPRWQNWTPAQKKQFNVICGPLMEELGYYSN